MVVVPLTTAGPAAAATVATLNRSRFVPLLNQSFAMVDTAGHQVPVVLSQISDLVAGPPGSQSRFSLTFDGPLSPARPQGTYRFRQSQIGEVALFAVPVGRSVQVRRYEAILFLR
jgi:hypothetical protein